MHSMDISCQQLSVSPQSPDFVFTEEFQIEYLKEHFKAFDALRQNGTLIGEMIWNFADFMTVQGNILKTN